jgi:hypothetical protein
VKIAVALLLVRAEIDITIHNNIWKCVRGLKRGWGSVRRKKENLFKKGKRPMKTETKRKIANLSIGLMIFTIVVIVYWFLVWIVASTFNLKVAAEKSTEFFFMIISAAFSVVVCAAFLNISLNISIIADSKAPSETGKSFGLLRIPLFALLVLTILTIAGLFAGDYHSRNHMKLNLIAESNDILKRYDKSIQLISGYLADSTKTAKIADVLEVLSSQKDDFPQISLIASRYYNNEITFLQLTQYSKDDSLLALPFFNNSFYKCNTHDCQYLKEIFTGKKTGILFWSEKDDFYLYQPIKTDKVHFVLLFSKQSRYGRYGS